MRWHQAAYGQILDDAKSRALFVKDSKRRNRKRVLRCDKCNAKVPAKLLDEAGHLCEDLCEFCLRRTERNYWHRIFGEREEPEPPTRRK